MPAKIISSYTWVDGKQVDMYPKPTRTHVTMLPDGRGYVCMCGNTYKNVLGQPNHVKTNVHRVLMGLLPFNELKRGSKLVSRPVGV